MKLKVLVVPEAVGGYPVSVPAMQGCYSEGETLEEALVNIREAAELWDADRPRLRGDRRPPAGCAGSPFAFPGGVR